MNNFAENGKTDNNKTVNINASTCNNNETDFDEQNELSQENCNIHLFEENYEDQDYHNYDGKFLVLLTILCPANERSRIWFPT